MDNSTHYQLLSKQAPLAENAELDIEQFNVFREFLDSQKITPEDKDYLLQNLNLSQLNINKDQQMVVQMDFDQEDAAPFKVDISKYR